MTVFMIADIKVTDPAWVEDYARYAHELVHKHGGWYLARSGNITMLEGEPADRTVFGIVAFPSEKALNAFLNDPDYAPLRAARQRGSVSTFYAVDDTDLVGTVSYLPKGG